MKDNKTKQSKIKERKKIALHYFETLVDVARESFLILDADLRVISANPVFYQNFQVNPAQTENRLLYKLGNGQWNIPKLRELLEEILPEKKAIKDYEVLHVFEKIGKKTMLLNARQIDTEQLIILAIEDISDRKRLERELVQYAKELEIKVAQRTEELADRVKELEETNKNMVGRELKMVELKKEIKNLKERLRNGNGKNGNGNGNHRNGR